MKITVAGIGYVGLSNAILLSQHNEVYAIDIDEKRVNMINNRRSPIIDPEIDQFLKRPELNLTATVDAKEAYTGADYIIIATPTDYDPELDYFNTSSIESVIESAREYTSDAIIVIRSTVPVGYTQRIMEKYNRSHNIFS